MSEAGPNIPKGAETEVVDPGVDAVKLTTNAFRHYTRDQIGSFVGVLDLISENAQVPDSLRQMAKNALEGESKIQAFYEKLDRVTQVVADETTQPGFRMLDIEKSTQPNPSTESK